MKVIFLDVDGILTYINSGFQNQGIDETRVDLLKEIVSETGAVIVLISSWKGYCLPNGTYYRPRIYYILERVLKEYALSIYDETRYIHPKYTKEYKKKKKNSYTLEEIENPTYKEMFDPTTTRAAEVNNWLKEHKDIESFVILDDEDHIWDYFGFDRYWIQPSWFEENGGLKKEHVERAITILNCKSGK